MPQDAGPMEDSVCSSRCRPWDLGLPLSLSDASGAWPALGRGRGELAVICSWSVHFGAQESYVRA